MPEIGQTISHYRITEKLGQGGMGEVFLAHDTTLDRKVALKFLPDIFSGDPERLARFEREAKLLASLNHPNIATIYGLEQADGKRFLAMELVEGETLAQQIERGPLPMNEALEVCRQIAEGLEAAHEKGIIHRDLKPANVKITPEGKVKILDFGLAKAFQDERPAVDASKSPTLTDQMTRPGVILGTAAYMSPEQAKGKAVDKRADIWAFGCILYECLTAKRPFHGETITETLASILKGEPDWNALPAGISWNLKVLLRRCLQKDPKERIHDIADVRIEIKEPLAEYAETATATRRVSLSWLSTGVAAMLLVGIVLGIVVTRYFLPTPSATPVEAVIKVEPGYRLHGDPMELLRPSRTALAISSDNKFIVYSAIEDNAGPQAKPRLFLRRLNKSQAEPIPGTEGAISPFLSPDNRWVGFWAPNNNKGWMGYLADGELRKVPVEGGIPQRLCSVMVFYGASWGRDNNIVFTNGDNPSTGYTSGLSMVSADGGEPTPLTKPDPKREEASHYLPSWLPNGKAVLFTVMRHFWDWRPRVALLRLDTHEWRVLLEDAADARYVTTGHLVFMRRGTLWAVPFDPDSLEKKGKESPIRKDVMQGFSTNTIVNNGAGQFSISGTGWLIYAHASGGIVPPENNSLMWVDQKGTEQPVTDKKSSYLGPRLSTDGRRIAYATIGMEHQLWVYDILGHMPNQVNEGQAAIPIWAPEGKQLIFSWMTSRVLNLFCQPYDASLPMKAFAEKSEFIQRPGSWSQDGKKLAIVESHLDTGIDVAILDIDSKQVTPFLHENYTEKTPEFSPDGHWIAYTSNEANGDQVYVTDFPNKSNKIQITSEGGEQPLWASDGNKLFYRRQGQIWVVDVRTEGAPHVTNRHMLFDKPEYWRGTGGVIRDYDLDPQSQQFLMVKFDQGKPSPVTEMVLTLNWFEELKRLAPIK